MNLAHLLMNKRVERDFSAMFVPVQASSKVLPVLPIILETLLKGISQLDSICLSNL